MSDWIKNQAEQIKKKEQDEKDQRAWLLYMQGKINDGWDGPWRQISREVQTQVSVFNEEFEGDASKQIELTLQNDYALTVKREHEYRYTIIDVKASSAGIARRINSGDRSNGRREAPDNQTLSWNATKHGVVGMASSVSLHPDGIDMPHEAAEAILRKLF